MRLIEKRLTTWRN